eukprot:INCI9187.5.p3 GENE.INCI9187.5~~INCI9187.5.p3  ORF type:complete len:132 (+),score=25.98 INCI9187.5:112-507(+)
MPRRAIDEKLLRYANSANVFTHTKVMSITEETATRSIRTVLDETILHGTQEEQTKRAQFVKCKETNTAKYDLMATSVVKHRRRHHNNNIEKGDDKLNTHLQERVMNHVVISYFVRLKGSINRQSCADVPAA